MLSFLKGLAGSDVFLELPDTEKGLIQLQWMSFIGGRVNVDNFQRVCMELRMQSSLEDGEWNLLKLGLEAMVRSQGFSEVDFRFIRLTMMTKGLYLEEGFGDLRERESRGRCYMVDERRNAQHWRIPWRDKSEGVEQLRGLLTKSRSDG